MSDNIYDFLLRKRNVKLLLIRFLLYQRIFEFCFLLLTPNSVLYYTVTPNAASACKNCRKSQTRNTARAMCAPQNHPNYPSYHLQNQEGWSSETHFFEMEPGPTASSYPKWPAGTPRGARAPPTEQFRAAAHLAENGSVSVLPTSNAHISLKSAFRDPRFSIEAESCLDLANGAKKNFRIFFGKNRNFLIRKIAIFIQILLSLSFFRILAFFLRKLRIKNTLSTNSKKKFKNSLIRTRTGRSKFCDFSSNFSKFSSNI